MYVKHTSHDVDAISIFIYATDMKIKVLGELDFVSCFFIIASKAVNLSTSPQKNKI